MHYLYDIFTVLYYNMATIWHTIKNLKKEVISKQFHTFEYVTWPQGAISYVNSLMM